MPTFATTCTAANDGYWDPFSSWITSGSQHVVGTTGGSSNEYGAVMRFTGVTIPAGAIVSAAKITLASVFGGGTPDIRIYMEAADNPTMPTTRTDAIGRQQTTAYGTYTGAVVADPLESVGLGPAVQEVISRGGWASGNAATGRWRNNKASGTGYFQPYQADYSSGSKAPALSATYTVPTVYTETGAGGVAVGGAAAALLAAALMATGGAALSGTAAAALATSDVGQGAVTIAGDAAASLVIGQIGSGGVAINGAASNVAAYSDLAQGGVVIGGAALAGLIFSAVASGGVVVGGSAELVSFASFVGSGGLSLAGDAAVGQVMAVSAAGGVEIAGSAAASASAFEAAAGGVLLSGSAATSATLAELAAGGVIVGGEASVSVYSPSAGVGGSFICDACHVFRAGSQAWHLFAGGAFVVGQFVAGERAHQVGGCQCTS